MNPVNPPRRQQVSKGQRFRIFNRDGFRCRYCGTTSAHAALVVDHVIPVKKGGTNDDANLLTSCQPCNAGKAARSIENPADITQDRKRIAKERRANIRAAKRAEEAAIARENFRQAVVDAWCNIRGIEDADSRTITVMVRYANMYGMDQVLDWIQKAHDKMQDAPDFKVGRYVSGIRRKMIENGEITQDGK